MEHQRSANTPAFVMYPGNPNLDYGPAATNIRHAGAINGTWQLPWGEDRLIGRLDFKRDRYVTKRLSFFTATRIQPD